MKADFDNECKSIPLVNQTNPIGVNINHEDAEPNGSVNNNLGEVVPVKCTNAGKLRKSEDKKFIYPKTVPVNSLYANMTKSG